MVMKQCHEAGSLRLVLDRDLPVYRARGQELRPGQPLRYGQSITDGCIDWHTSVAALQTLAQAVRQRRLAAAAVLPAEAAA